MHCHTDYLEVLQNDLVLLMSNSLLQDVKMLVTGLLILI